MINEKRFREYLALYGADMNQWPLHLQAEGDRVKALPGFAVLIAEEARFDALLRCREVAAPQNGLAERILYAARTKTHSVSNAVSWLQELLSDILLPQPALAAVLAMGLAIGFVVVMPASDSKETPVAQTSIYEEGMML